MSTTGTQSEEDADQFRLMSTHLSQSPFLGHSLTFRALDMNSLGDGDIAVSNLYGFGNMVRCAFSSPVLQTNLLKAMPEYEGSMSMPNDELSSELGHTPGLNASISVAFSQPISCSANDFPMNCKNCSSINYPYPMSSPPTLQDFGHYEQGLQSLYCPPW